MFLFLIFTYVFVHVQVHMCVRVFRLYVCVCTRVEARG